jgi:hypothetical protein
MQKFLTDVFRFSYLPPCILFIQEIFSIYIPARHCKTNLTVVSWYRYPVPTYCILFLFNPYFRMRENHREEPV